MRHSAHQPRFGSRDRSLLFLGLAAAIGSLAGSAAIAPEATLRVASCAPSAPAPAPTPSPKPSPKPTPKPKSAVEASMG